MRARVKKGVLVASTNRLRYIQSKRLVVEVIYNFRHGIISQRTMSIRQTINQ